MSEMLFERGKFFFTDDRNSTLILDVRDYAANKSRMHSHLINDGKEVIRPLEEEVNRAIKKIFQGTLVSPGDFHGSNISMAHVVTYLLIIARLLRKPQIHNVLIIGQAATLEEVLTETFRNSIPRIEFDVWKSARKIY